MHTSIRPITTHAPMWRLNAKPSKRLPHQPDLGSRRDGNAIRICWRGSTHSEAELDYRKVTGAEIQRQTGFGPGPSHYGILTIPDPPLHGQRQDLPLSAVGPHRRIHRHSHRAYASVSARRPRQDRTLLPFGARTVSGLARSQSSALYRATQRTLVALARRRISPP